MTVILAAKAQQFEPLRRQRRQIAAQRDHGLELGGIEIAAVCQLDQNAGMRAAAELDSNQPADIRSVGISGEVFGKPRQRQVEGYTRNRHDWSRC